MKISRQTSNSMELKESNLFSYFIAIILAVTAFSLLFTNEIEPPILLGFLILLAIAIFIFLTAKNVHIIIDKSNKLIKRSEKSILKKRSDEINIEQLDHINVREVKSYTKDDDGYSRKNYSYRILLVLKDNREILLNYNSSSRKFLFFKLKSKDQKTGEKIAKFLELPYKKSFSS
jgi:hypothetical protein